MSPGGGGATMTSFQARRASMDVLKLRAAFHEGQELVGAVPCASLFVLVRLAESGNLLRRLAIF